MPTSVVEAFAAAGLNRQAVVRWRTRPATTSSGVYVEVLTVEITDDKTVAIG